MVRRHRYRVGRRSVASFAPALAALIGLAACTTEFDPVQEFDRGLRAYKAANYAAARTIWSELAASGDGVAQLFLGDLLVRGDGVPRDPVQAVALYRAAAAQGVVAAARRLGDAYARGEGVALNTIAAERWYTMAAAAGDSEATSEVFPLRPPAAPAEATPALVEPPTPAPDVPDFGATRLVLASAADRGLAERAWVALYAAAPGRFAGRRAAVVRVNHGPPAGVRYEVQLGPFFTAGEAEALCRSLTPRLAPDCRITR